MKINKKTALKIAVAFKGLIVSLTGISLYMQNKNLALATLITGAVVNELINFLKENDKSNNN